MKALLNKEKFTWGGLHPFSHHPLVFNFVPDLKDKTVLDCGCGKGIWGFLIRTVRPLGKGRMIGIDMNREYLDFCKKHAIYDQLISGSVSKLPNKNLSVDFLICSEVIEHLTPTAGRQFLAEIDRVMRPGGRAIVTTPNMKLETFIEKGPDAHHSIWTVADFKKQGYRVYGAGICISPGISKWYTKPILALSHITSVISYFIPGVAGFLVAVKDF